MLRANLLDPKNRGFFSNRWRKDVEKGTGSYLSLDCRLEQSPPRFASSDTTCSWTVTRAICWVRDCAPSSSTDCPSCTRSPRPSPGAGTPPPRWSSTRRSCWCRVCSTWSWSRAQWRRTGAQNFPRNCEVGWNSIRDHGVSPFPLSSRATPLSGWWRVPWHYLPTPAYNRDRWNIFSRECNRSIPSTESRETRGLRWYSIFLVFSTFQFSISIFYSPIFNVNISPISWYLMSQISNATD